MQYRFIAIGVAATLVTALVTTLSGQQPPAQPEAPDQPLFRSSVRTVSIYATVLDRTGRLVPDLQKDDFVVLDDGKPVELTLFSNEPQPFTVVVMLDTSASMTANLDLLNAAAEQFLLRLHPEDRARVGAFNDKIQISDAFTNDRDALIKELKELQFGNPTRLNDAIDVSLDALEQVDGRRVVLMFSDGEDTASNTSFRAVQDRARNLEVMVYAIGLESEYFNGLRVQRSRPSRLPGWPRSSAASICWDLHRPPLTANRTSWKCGSSGRGSTRGRDAVTLRRRIASIRHSRTATERMAMTSNAPMTGSAVSENVHE
jgi:hypothetical protein